MAFFSLHNLLRHHLGEQLRRSPVPAVNPYPAMCPCYRRNGKISSALAYIDEREAEDRDFPPHSRL
jgi:hypothetical protein